MTFVHALLLAGAALAVVPIVLHLVMRRKPLRLEFPALQLVRQRHETNRRRIRLRHLILLALRVAAIVLLAFALARPSIRFSGSLGSREAPVAAALVFDTAPRMQYRHANQTRLEAAQALAQWLLPQLPAESQIGVLDTQQGPAAFQVDRAAAAQRIEKLATVNPSQPLTAALGEAFDLLARSDLERKEVYVFTDLAGAAWPANASVRMQSLAAELAGVSVYVIDVGVKDPTDYGLGELRLSAQSISNRGSLSIETELIRTGPSGERGVELFVLDHADKPSKRGEEIVELTDDSSAAVGFQLSGLDIGTHQGYARIVGQDSLAADDVRYFSFEVRRPWKILVVDPEAAHAEADFLIEMLAPESWRKAGLSRFECDRVTQGELSKTALDGYAAVCLIDPRPMSLIEWDKLNQYVSAGGGLAVFLGRDAKPITSFNTPAAQQLLPGPLVRQSRAPQAAPFYFAPRSLQHPMLSAFRQARGGIPWSDMPVYRYWELGRLAGGTNVVVPFSDGRPAMLERNVGEGRVIVMTTPISDTSRDNPWNLAPITDPWPMLILMNQTMLYLAGSTDQQLNYYAGQPATVSLDGSARYRSYLVTTPSGIDFTLSTDPRQSQLMVTSTNEVGNYRIQAGGRAAGASYGFSVNLTPRQTQLARLTPDELAERFGPIPYRVAENRNQIERDVNMARVGRELFPLLILLVALAMAIEHVLANRFYRE